MTKYFSRHLRSGKGQWRGAVVERSLKAQL